MSEPRISDDDSDVVGDVRNLKAVFRDLLKRVERIEGFLVLGGDPIGDESLEDQHKRLERQRIEQTALRRNRVRPAAR